MGYPGDSRLVVAIGWRRRRFDSVGLAARPRTGAGRPDDDDAAEEEPKPVEGTFVGKARGTEAFVAVVASPAPKGERRRDATVFVCDAKALCEWLTGSARGNEFTAASPDDDAEAKGSLTGNAARGSIKVSAGKTLNFVASPAAATAGLYTLTVSSKGKLTGASAAGVGLTGKSTLPRPGPGTLKLADGTRIKFTSAKNSSGDPIRLPAGEMRAIVLQGRQLRGAGKNRGSQDSRLPTSSCALALDRRADEGVHEYELRIRQTVLVQAGPR